MPPVKQPKVCECENDNSTPDSRRRCRKYHGCTKAPRTRGVNSIPEKKSRKAINADHRAKLADLRAAARNTASCQTESPVPVEITRPELPGKDTVRTTKLPPAEEEKKKQAELHAVKDLDPNK